MQDYLCISVTFLDERFHGRADARKPEWPPSPLRLMQAIIAANSDNIGCDSALDHALEWLERQNPPLIIAPPFRLGSAYCLSVPNNAMDLVGRAWSKGKYFGTGDANPATHRTMKSVRPVQLERGDTVHYLWPLMTSPERASDVTGPLAAAARRIVALGWGADLAVGNAHPLSASQFYELEGEHWSPAPSDNCPAALRSPIRGTLRALQDRHRARLLRIGASRFAPVEPLTHFDMIGYRRPSDPRPRPHAVFELRRDDGSFCTHPQRKLIHISGMVRHLAIDAMRRDPPPLIDNPGEWVSRYVRGKRDDSEETHRQLSYIPLPSIGNEYADHNIRRVTIAAPYGDDDLLNYIAARLSGRQLKPENDEFGGEAPALCRVHGDNVSHCYTQPANRWASVTPVILPGYDDRNESKRVRLIYRALAQAGIEQECEYEWSPVARFRNALSAHARDRSGRPIFYRPEYLRHLTAVHLTLTFHNGSKVPGPIAIGAGRHCGFGILAGL